eukprot:1511659-Rhodomonas_salina.1
MYQQELLTSSQRPTGSNPKIFVPGRDDTLLQRFLGASQQPPGRLVVFSFAGNSHPLRTSLSGRFSYAPILLDNVRKDLDPFRCNEGHSMDPWDGRGRCHVCKSYAQVPNTALHSAGLYPRKPNRMALTVDGWTCLRAESASVLRVLLFRGKCSGLHVGCIGMMHILLLLTMARKRRKFWECDCKLMYGVVWVQCKKCVQAHENDQIAERSDPAGKSTALICDSGCEISLLVPPVSSPDEPVVDDKVPASRKLSAESSNTLHQHPNLDP